MRRICGWYIVFLLLYACGKATDVPPADKGYAAEHITHIVTGNTTPMQVIAYARSLNGVPYKYGSTDSAQGFDCSGFITYVFNHFGIRVPRQSVDFTPVGRDIDLNNARPGDLVLFTGTDTTSTVVGHMGILVSLPGQAPVFIHSTSGKNKGVTETPLNTYYVKRYIKTIRIFPQNDLFPVAACQDTVSAGRSPVEREHAL